MTSVTGPALTLDECAADLRVSKGILLGQIKAGRLAALCLALDLSPTSKARKNYRVERAEWERFKASIRLRPPQPPAEEPKSIPKGRRPKGAEREDNGLLGNYRDRKTS